VSGGGLGKVNIGGDCNGFMISENIINPFFKPMAKIKKEGKSPPFL